MVFTSSSFIFLFLPVFLLLDRLLRGYARNWLLIVASLLFYVWGEGEGVLLLIALCLINLLFGRVLWKLTQGGDGREEHRFAFWARGVLALGVVFNLGVLFFYKYLAWIVNELSALSLFGNLYMKEHALPLGISFFTFHAVSYLVDVYKGVVKQHGGVDFATYFFMFPHLVAGPIVRFESVRSDIQDRTFQRELFSYGVFRFILGVNKKVLVANFVAPMADLAFFAPPQAGSLGCLDAWIGIVAYTVQIYFDFSGYSDMAIGLAAMMGIRFDENFLSPYKSCSIKEFWRRWHISLSSWLRDYLFIPLGGSRCSKWLNYRNLLIVFILCGLWHGAQFTFLVWGLFHGMLLVLEKTPFGGWLENKPVLVRRGYCMLMVLIGWVFFRAESLGQATDYLRVMFSFNQTSSLHEVFGMTNYGALIVGMVLALVGKEYFRYGHENEKHIPVLLFAVNMLLFVVSLAVLYTNTRNPFIYFNF